MPAPISPCHARHFTYYLYFDFPCCWYAVATCLSRLLPDACCLLLADCCWVLLLIWFMRYAILFYDFSHTPLCHVCYRQLFWYDVASLCLICLMLTLRYAPYLCSPITRYYAIFSPAPDEAFIILLFWFRVPRLLFAPGVDAVYADVESSPAAYVCWCRAVIHKILRAPDMRLRRRHEQRLFYLFAAMICLFFTMILLLCAVRCYAWRAYVACLPFRVTPSAAIDMPPRFYDAILFCCCWCLTVFLRPCLLCFHSPILMPALDAQMPLLWLCPPRIRYFFAYYDFPCYEVSLRCAIVICLFMLRLICRAIGDATRAERRRTMSPCFALSLPITLIFFCLYRQDVTRFDTWCRWLRHYWCFSLMLTLFHLIFFEFFAILTPDIVDFFFFRAYAMPFCHLPDIYYFWWYLLIIAVLPVVIRAISLFFPAAYAFAVIDGDFRLICYRARHLMPLCLLLFAACHFRRADAAIYVSKEPPMMFSAMSASRAAHIYTWFMILLFLCDAYICFAVFRYALRSAILFSLRCLFWCHFDVFDVIRCPFDVFMFSCYYFALTIYTRCERRYYADAFFVYVSVSICSYVLRWRCRYVTCSARYFKIRAAVFFRCSMIFFDAVITLRYFRSCFAILYLLFRCWCPDIISPAIRYYAFLRYVIIAAIMPLPDTPYGATPFRFLLILRDIIDHLMPMIFRYALCYLPLLFFFVFLFPLCCYWCSSWCRYYLLIRYYSSLLFIIYYDIHDIFIRLPDYWYCRFVIDYRRWYRCLLTPFFAIIWCLMLAIIFPPAALRFRCLLMFAAWYLLVFAFVCFITLFDVLPVLFLISLMAPLFSVYFTRVCYMLHADILFIIIIFFITLFHALRLHITLYAILIIIYFILFRSFLLIFMLFIILFFAYILLFRHWLSYADFRLFFIIFSRHTLILLMPLFWYSFATPLFICYYHVCRCWY